ncbi:hypothetical protein [Corynebacterium pacaense]|uniref:hypothetical protein n=1 Tax=Corynebacterium pacaense TaxID=1816684 RepID=UPI0009B96228|nr:hypothetical protein [Corynebacterium pacaense]
MSGTGATASELYTATRVRSLQVTIALVVLAAVFGSAMVWALPSLMTQVGAQDAEAAAGMGVDLGAYSPENPGFQLMALDVSGSFQSGMPMIILVVIALAVLIPGMSFRYGAVTWKVLLVGGRLRWAVGTLGAVACLTAAVGVVSAIAVAAVGYGAAAVQGTNISVSVWELLGMWLRGIGTLVLIAVMSSAVVIALRSLGRALAVIAGVAVLGILLNTVGTFAGWEGGYFSWLPLNAAASAVGVSPQAPLSIAAGWGVLTLWTVLAVAWGLIRVRRYTL